MAPTPLQHRSMHRYWKLAGVSDRRDRLALTGAVVERPITSSAELTEAEAERVVRYQRWLVARGQLAAAAARWLAANRPTAARRAS